MEFKKYFRMLLILGLGHPAIGQQYFTAIVRDSLTQEALTGVAVVEQGTTNGAVTDVNGKVRFPVSGIGDVIFTLQYVGYIDKNIVVPIPQPDSLLTIFLSADNVALNEVTVSSVRTNSRIEDIPTRVEVLGLDDLNEENGVKPGNIMSLLGDIAGIQMQQVSASSGNTLARIQGLNGRYTQLLKDGMPLFGGLSGSFGILQIPPLDLKQIEIIKGSVSTLYGGDAIGGIINLVSKDPLREPEISLTANQSSLLETNLNAYFAKRNEKTGVTFFAAQTFQKVGDVDRDGLSDVPQVNSTVVHPRLIFYLQPGSTLTFNYTGTFDNRQGGDMRYFGDLPGDTLFHIQNKVQRHNADARWSHELSRQANLSVKFSTSFLNQELETKAYTFDAGQLIYYSEISYVRKLEKADWVAGVNFNGDVFDNQTESLAGVEDYAWRTFGAFLQNTWRPAKKFNVETGFRGDYHSQYGFFPLPRLSLMYQFHPQWTARVNGGFGYKIPNLITYVNPETDLNAIASNTVLQPELSQGINADINFDRLFFNELNVTVNQSFFFTNLSHPVFDSSSTVTKTSLANAGRGLQTKGLQTYARVQYRHLEFYLGYVFTDVTKTYDTENPVPSVTPKHNFATTFFWEPAGKWRMGIESSLIGGQLDQNYDPVKNYLLVAGMIQLNLKHLTFVLNGENLLDFRQNRFEKIYDGTIDNPVFHQLWAPIDGRVINLSVKWEL